MAENNPFELDVIREEPGGGWRFAVFVSDEQAIEQGIEAEPGEPLDFDEVWPDDRSITLALFEKLPIPVEIEFVEVGEREGGCESVYVARPLKRYILAMEKRWPGCWGRGETVEEAKKQAKKAGARRRTFIFMEAFGTDEKPPYVDDFAAIYSYGAKRPAEVDAEGKPKPAKGDPA